MHSGGFREHYLPHEAEIHATFDIKQDDTVHPNSSSSHCVVTKLKRVKVFSGKVLMLRKFYETIKSQNELQRTIQSLYARLAELFMSEQDFHCGVLKYHSLNTPGNAVCCKRVHICHNWFTI